MLSATRTTKSTVPLPRVAGLCKELVDEGAGADEVVGLGVVFFGASVGAEHDGVGVAGVVVGGGAEVAGAGEECSCGGY